MAALLTHKRYVSPATAAEATLLDPAARDYFDLAMFGTPLIGGSLYDWGWRETAAGIEASRHWLGVRDWLRAHESFADEPTGGGDDLGPYLGYGLALGVARVAEEQLDFGPIRRDLLWSARDGGWQRVRVTYPSFDLQHGANLPRLLANLTLRVFGLLVFGVFWLMLLAFGSVVAVALAIDNNLAWLAIPVILIDLVLLFFLVRSAARWPYCLVRVILDQRRLVEATGTVLRVDQWEPSLDIGKGEASKALYHLVLDDGRAGELTAWVVPDPYAEQCPVGRRVRIAARPWTRRVYEVTPVRW